MLQTYSPQQILDMLHDADVPGLFATGMSVRDHREALARTKQKLNETDQRLRQAMDDVREANQPVGSKKKKGPDPALQNRLKLEMAPYLVLANLLKELRSKVGDLEKAMEAGKLYPEPFAFDDFIFGDPKSGEWFLGDEEASEMWEYGMRVKGQLEGFMEQRAPLAARIKAMSTELKALKKRIQSATATLKADRKSGPVSARAAIMFLVGAGLIAGGAFMALAQNDIPVGGGLAGVGLLVLILIPVLRSRHKKKMAQLDATLKAWRAEFEEKAEALKKAQREFTPLNGKCKDLYDEWSAIRKGF